MALTKFYKIIKPEHDSVAKADSQGLGSGMYGNYTWYHRLVQGSAARLVKYKEYDIMDNDIDIARSLDIIAEEITGNNPKTKQPLLIQLIDEPDQKIPSRTIVTLKSALRTWCKVQQWDKRIFELARHTVKYGDCFFLRPKNINKKYSFVHAKNIVSAAVAENDVTDVKGWYIKTDFMQVDNNSPDFNIGGFSSSQSNDAGVEVFDVKDVIRYSLNDDMSPEAPFGVSILRPVYTTFKQKELLEDAILIYRIQRAPERRVFYIDVGRMPSHKISAHLNQIKDEIKQKKIPSTFGGKAQVESIYNPQSMCLALDTKIPLLDGRTLTLDEMIAEHDNGKENWVYSVNPENGDVAPGIVSWAGITRRDAETITLTLDNGKTITCTPDHNFPVQGKGKVMAKDLTPEDSLYPFNVRDELINKSTKVKTKYTQVYSPITKGWKFVHRVVGDYMRRINEHNEFKFIDHNNDMGTIHHADFNAKNNSPSNLLFMNNKDHSAYHASLTPPQSVQFTKELFDRFEELVNNNGDIKLKDFFTVMNNDETFLNIYRESNQATNGIQCKIKVDKMRQKIFLKFLKAFGFKNWREYRNTKIQNNISLSYVPDSPYDSKDIKLINRIIYLIKTVSVHNYAIVTYLKENLIEWDMLVGLYENSNIKNDRALAGNYQTLQVPEAGMLERMSKYFGYNNFKHLVTEASNFNHKIVKIESNINQDVGTLTIDQDEKYHKYHTFALESGCYTFNSQDFFFAQRSDGSGSRVETLPGGQGLGELSDLEYFYKKMWRAMRIPQSYMSNTMEDGSTDNNGRVGIAYMQEIKFTLYIQRLQTHIERVMDAEFKKYLYALGVHVDPTIYDVILPEPSDYSKSRDQSMNAEFLSTYTTSDGIESLSKRFALRKYLQLDPDEILENERLKSEELGLDVNADIANLPKIYNPDAAELGGFEGGLGGGGAPDAIGDDNMPADDLEDGEGGEEANPDDTGEDSDTEAPNNA